MITARSGKLGPVLDNAVPRIRGPMPAARFALPDSRPVAPAASVLAGDHWRITVLLDGLLRLEWSGDGGFEDRASTFAVHRDLPVPAFEVTRSDDRLEILTERLHLTWDLQPFSAAGLTVQVRGRVSNHRSTWRWGRTPQTLGGTGRTLDMADGAKTGCTPRRTRSCRRSRGPTRGRRATRWARPCVSATGWCPTCTP